MPFRASPELAAFVAPAEYVDSDHPAVVAQAASLRLDDPQATVVAVFDFVRDLTYEAEDFESLDTYRASRTLEVGHGYCVSKAALFTALVRASGVAARLAFADVRNHLATPRLLAAMGTDVFAWHGYSEVHLDGRWVRVSPTFDSAMCARLGVDPLRFDGHSDALLQAFDGGGTMRYERHHGTFHDVPARFLAREMPCLYPFTRDGGIERFKHEEQAARP